MNALYKKLYGDPPPRKRKVLTVTYRGAHACPQCGSVETGTDCIATSRRFMRFGCDACGHEFNRAASSVSGLSRLMQDMARGMP